jgi:hypothetical protein
MEHDRNKRHYHYQFSNGETHIMTPVEAHRYSIKKKIDIFHGPGYSEGKREKSFDGWGWHSGLLRSFKGPKDYRDYLKANNMVEAGLTDCPIYDEYEPPVWTEELIRRAINVHGVEIGGVMAEALLKGECDWPDGSSAGDDSELMGLM